MIELPLIVLGGLLGSSHCLGMCGPFAISIGLGAAGPRENLRRQLVYSLGRVFTYSTLGAVAGFAGLRLVQQTSSLVNVSAALSIVAGILLVVQGALSANLVPRRRVRVGARKPCLSASLFSSFLQAPGLHNVFLAGLATGFLPCGLVYAFLALATSTADLFQGWATMAAFGVGTIPLMVLTGAGASLLGLATRKHLFRVAGVCVMLTGLLAIGRGAGFVEIPGFKPRAGCPACDQARAAGSAPTAEPVLR